MRNYVFPSLESLLQKTLKASPLSNRGVRSTPGWQYMSAESTLEESPICADIGALLQSASCLDTHHPQVVPTYGY